MRTRRAGADFTPELAGDRLVIKAPPNPLRGVTVEDAAYTKSEIEQVDGPVLLVAQQLER